MRDGGNEIGLHPGQGEFTAHRAPHEISARQGEQRHRTQKKLQQDVAPGLEMPSPPAGAATATAQGSPVCAG